MISEADLAYCAGVIDSDGTIGIRKLRDDRRKPGYSYVRYYEMLSLVQIEPQAVTLFKELFGGSSGVRKRRLKKRGSGVVRKKRKVGTERYRDMYTWVIQSVKASSCLRSILPYLRIKSEQAANCLSFREVMEEYKSESRVSKGLAGSRKRSSEWDKKLDPFVERQRLLNSGVK